VAAALAALPPLVTSGAAAEPNRRARGHRVARLLAAQGLAAGGAAGRVSGSEAAGCLRAMARLRCAPRGAVAGLAARLVERDGAAIALLQPRELAAAAWALAVIERRQGDGWWEEEEDERAAAASAELGRRDGDAAAALSDGDAPATPHLRGIEEGDAADGGEIAAAALQVLQPAPPAAAPPPAVAASADEEDEGEDGALVLTSALLARLPVPEPPPVPPRGRGAAPPPPALPPLRQQQQAARPPTNSARGRGAADQPRALVAAAPAPPAVEALWRLLEARSRALVHNFAPEHAAALAWAFAATGRCSNHGRVGGVSMMEKEEEEEEEEEDEAEGGDEVAAAAPSARPPSRRRRAPVHLLTALSRSLLLRRHTLTDSAAVARLLEALSLAATTGPSLSASSSSSPPPPPPPPPALLPPLLPRAQRELASALADRVPLLKAAFSPPAQLVGCLASLARMAVAHDAAAGAVGAMVASRLGPAVAAGAAGAPAAAAGCLRGGWLPADVAAYLSAAQRLGHSDPPALFACARALPAAAPHLAPAALAGALEALVDLGLGGVEAGMAAAAAAAAAGARGGGADGGGGRERRALRLAADAVRAEVDRAGPAGLTPGAAARLLWAYAMVWGDELLLPERGGRRGSGGGEGATSPAAAAAAPSPLDTPLRALRRRLQGAGGGGPGGLSPLEMHRLYQAHRLLTEEWALEQQGRQEDDDEDDDDDHEDGGRWPARLVRAAAAAARRRFGRGDPSSSSSSPRLQHLCDLLSEAGIAPIVGAGGADGGAIPVDVAVVLEEEEEQEEEEGQERGGAGRPPRLVALLLDEPPPEQPTSAWRGRRASNPPHALLGAAEADARLLTERLGWSAAMRLPWYEWEAALAAEGQGAERGASAGRGVRLRGGGSAAAALRRAREEEDEEEADAEPDDGALLAWVHNKLLSAGC
jgi:hypothetical protein